MRIEMRIGRARDTSAVIAEDGVRVDCGGGMLVIVTRGAPVPLPGAVVVVLVGGDRTCCGAKTPG